MHIMEGFLPAHWCLIWYLIAIPFLVLGVIRLRALIREDRELLPLLGVSGAFIFILSALKLPSVTGSCSHPTGTGLSAVCFGPAVTSVLGSIVLLFQALLLAHGGISTLGANIVSMGICGPAIGYGLYRLLKDTRVNMYITVFLATFAANLMTYVVTSLQIALAFPAPEGGVITSAVTFLGIFALTQFPLAIVEGCVIALVFKYIVRLKPDVLINLKVFSEEKIAAGRDSA